MTELASFRRSPQGPPPPVSGATDLDPLAGSGLITPALPAGGLW